MQEVIGSVFKEQDKELNQAPSKVRHLKGHHRNIIGSV